MNRLYNPSEKKDDKGRIYYFDNLKFLLIFLVVFGHFINPLKFTNDLAKSSWYFIYTFHMPLFIFVSGCFAKKSIEKKKISKVWIFLMLYIILKLIIYMINKFYYGLNVEFTIFSEATAPWYLLGMAIWYSISMITKDTNKKYLLICSVFISLIIGLDKNIGDFLSLSKIISFYPFFVLGTIINQEKIEEIINHKNIKIISAIFLIVIITFYINFINKIQLLSPIINARGYYLLNDNIRNYGILFKSGWYIINILISISIMSLVPKGKLFFTKLGSRTLAVYFLHIIIVTVFAREGIKLRIYQYLIISIIVTLLFSLKCFSIPFNKLMSIDFKSKFKGFKFKTKSIINVIIAIMICVICFCVLIFMDRREVMIYYKSVRESKYVAHGLGGIDGNTYTDSKEALENSYKKGFKHFEADINLTSDNELVLVHGWTKNDYKWRLGLEYNKENPIMDYETFMNIKIKGKYTPLSFKNLAEFMSSHKDMYVMVDIGNKSYEETKEIYEKIVKDANYNNNVLQRLIVGGHTMDMIKAVKETYNFKLINLYWASNNQREKEIYSKKEFVNYCLKNNITSVSIATSNYTEKFGTYMKNNGIIVYVFTENEKNKAKEILQTADLVGTDFINLK